MPMSAAQHEAYGRSHGWGGGGDRGSAIGYAGGDPARPGGPQSRGGAYRGSGVGGEGSHINFEGSGPSFYDAAHRDWSNADNTMLEDAGNFLGRMFGVRELEPKPGHVGMRADWSWDPAGTLGSLGGGIPGGMAADALSWALGRPGAINLGQRPFAGAGSWLDRNLPTWDETRDWLGRQTGIGAAAPAGAALPGPATMRERSQFPGRPMSLGNRGGGRESGMAPVAPAVPGQQASAAIGAPGALRPSTPLSSSSSPSSPPSSALAWYDENAPALAANGGAASGMGRLRRNRYQDGGMVDEAGFRRLYDRIAKKTGIDRDPDDPRHMYDYRAALAGGARPRRNAEGEYHWPDLVGGERMKSPEHPTYWAEPPPLPERRPLSPTQAGPLRGGSAVGMAPVRPTMMPEVRPTLPGPGIRPTLPPKDLIGALIRTLYPDMAAEPLPRSRKRYQDAQPEPPPRSRKKPKRPRDWRPTDSYQDGGLVDPKMARVTGQAAIPGPPAAPMLAASPAAAGVAVPATAAPPPREDNGWAAEFTQIVGVPPQDLGITTEDEAREWLRRNLRKRGDREEQARELMSLIDSLAAPEGEGLISTTGRAARSAEDDRLAQLRGSIEQLLGGERGTPVAPAEPPVSALPARGYARGGKVRGAEEGRYLGSLIGADIIPQGPGKAGHYREYGNKPGFQKWWVKRALLDSLPYDESQSDYTPRPPALPESRRNPTAPRPERRPKGYAEGGRAKREIDEQLDDQGGGRLLRDMKQRVDRQMEERHNSDIEQARRRVRARVLRDREAARAHERERLSERRDYLKSAPMPGPRDLGEQSPFARDPGAWRAPSSPSALGVDPRMELRDRTGPVTGNLYRPWQPPGDTPYFKEMGAADGGRMANGGGDGRSDGIPAMLSDGEWVVPADVVSALGRGSSKAGAEKLTQMADRVRSGYREHTSALPAPRA